MRAHRRRESGFHGKSCDFGEVCTCPASQLRFLMPMNADQFELVVSRWIEGKTAERRTVEHLLGWNGKQPPTQQVAQHGQE
ncbi:hypothetical protein [Blastopirellula retiformator]|uniref:hypothetical protein n=1 Tax=Blastopirellula retiformator TaxID=2527970 RepID=UPI0011B543DC|nr:hypothetical protein [Blastopirellula retiformator]